MSWSYSVPFFFFFFPPPMQTLDLSYLLFCRRFVLLALHRFFFFFNPWRKANLKISSFNGKATETISRFVQRERMNEAGNGFHCANRGHGGAVNGRPQDFFSPFLKRSSINAAVMVPCTAQPSSLVTPKPGRLFSKARFSNSALWGVGGGGGWMIMQEAARGGELVLRKGTSF